MRGAAEVAAVAALLAAFVSDASHAQTPTTIVPADAARRLEALSKLVDQYASLTKALDGPSIVREASKASAGGIKLDAAGMHAAVASEILSKNVSAALDRQGKDAAAAAATLSHAAQEVSAMEVGAARARLDSIVAPQVVVDLFTTTTEGEALPPPPHLEGRPAPAVTLGDFVVGPGSNATVAYPSVASVNYRFEGYGSSTTCTGTLISATHVLTAAHCFCDLANAADAKTCRSATYKRNAERLSVLDPGYFTVFFQDAGVRSVKRIEIDPAYVKPVADLAVLELSAPLSGLAPAPLQSEKSAAILPLSVVVGFGQHGEIGPTGRPRSPAAPRANSQGLKLYAYVKPERCKGDEAGKALVCWHAVRTAGGEALGTTCHGDSGGPLFTKVAGRWVLTGVTSIGPLDCGLGGRDDAEHQYVDVSIGAEIGWIGRFVGDPAASLSHGTPFVSDADARVYDTKYRVFFEPFDNWSDTFVIDGSRSKLSVAVNANPTFSKLKVSLEPPNSRVPACAQSTDDAVIVCDVDHPAPGKWRLIVSGSRPQETQVVGSVDR